MNGSGAMRIGMGARRRARVTAAVASAALLMLALAGCVSSDTDSSTTTPSPTPTSTAGDPTPLPTTEPLIVPGCENLLPLTTAKDLFSPSTEFLDDRDTAAAEYYDLPELDTVAANSTISKNCIWGVPNSGGAFTLTVADINNTDAANLTAALLSAGYLSVTSGGVTTFEFTTEGDTGTIARTHYLVGDLWIYVDGTSPSLTTEVADRALDEIRTANPTRSY
ncbi:hypothetical protein FB472_1710 [Rhodoglobus vestalii]|uniref:DUF3558 domain-containing protein n=1 Tax=Rhodoglobus vestalii TaxID=193384 RepID=A0A8H2K6Z9_9MICO|nr:hypothetical protein [Rhodoglobus vestalii]TQO20099.1 hypothetical protein FB472_1710 [Rhodoglobus vestalii]